MRKPLLGHDAGDSKDRFPNDTAVSAEVDTIRNRAEATRGTGQVQPTRFHPSAGTEHRQPRGAQQRRVQGPVPASPSSREGLALSCRSSRTKAASGQTTSAQA